MKKFTQKLIADLRLSDDRRKTRWIFGLTAVSFLLIFSLWLAFYRFVVFARPASFASNPADSTPGFIDTAKRGLATVSDVIKRTANGENILTVTGGSSAPVFVPVLPPEPPPHPFPSL